MKLYNTITRRIDNFKPQNPSVVTFYACGPTVYDVTHIGHLRTYINNDLLKRALLHNGYTVQHVMNITDVGHLTGDDDSGDDKLEKGAKKAGKTVWDVAKYYTDYFLTSIQKVNISLPQHMPKATDHIPLMVDLIKRLERKGFTYETDEAIYFDISKWPKYGALSGQKLDDKMVKAREAVVIDKQKKHPADFVLWFKRVSRFADHIMYWSSPWAPPSGQGSSGQSSVRRTASARRGDGFPGWHIECSAMSMKYLGDTIDIHAGGIDHIPVHHENEIAQSEAATGKTFVNIWFHNNFLLVNGEKMSKSLGNLTTLDDIVEKKFNPMALRYLFLQTHYRQMQNFTWDSLSAAQTAYDRLTAMVLQLRIQTERTNLSEEKLEKINQFRDEFNNAIGNDLQIPLALSVLWEMLKSNIPSTDKLDLLYDFDEVFGLNLRKIIDDEIPQEIMELAKKREEARNNKDFTASDYFRDKIVAGGYTVEDTPSGFRIRKR